MGRALAQGTALWVLTTDVLAAALPSPWVCWGLPKRVLFESSPGGHLPGLQMDWAVEVTAVSVMSPSSHRV